MSNDRKGNMLIEAQPTLTRMPIKRFENVNALEYDYTNDTLLCKDERNEIVGRVRLPVMRSVTLVTPVKQRTVHARAIIQDGITALLRA